jgi:enediyne biosynthesis protein E4
MISCISYAFFSLPCEAQEKLFSVLGPEETGIDFTSQYRQFDNPIEGSGLAATDLDGDGLADLVLLGNPKTAVYRNHGDMRFEDVSQLAGLPDDKGASSVAVADIDMDGLPDIIIAYQEKYRSDSTAPGVRLFLNRGGMRFEEATSSFLPDIRGYISKVNLFDVDNDGDLDMLVGFWNLFAQRTGQGSLPNANNPGRDSVMVDMLLINDGGRFTDRTAEFGLFLRAPVHTSFNSIASDINGDGFIDLIISNDFDGPDHVFINDRGTRFIDSTDHYLEVMSFSSMGSEWADINNDGRMDLFTVDMRPLGNLRSKTLMFESPYGWHHAYAGGKNPVARQKVRNTLHLNLGDGEMAEIGELAGVDATDWSWCPLIADLDNDGLKDLFVTNGQWFNLNLEYDFALLLDSLKRVHGRNANRVLDSLDNQVPAHYTNHFYRNLGGLRFKDRTFPWCDQQPMSSRGAAYSDLDNDGDLDLVVMNSKSPVAVYRNNSGRIAGRGGFLRIRLRADMGKSVWNSKATLYHPGGLQVCELMPLRGFYSTSEDVLHFGLGHEAVDSVVIQWHGGGVTTLRDLPRDTLITVAHSSARTHGPAAPERERGLLTETALGMAVKHEENGYNDFVIDPLLPRFYSRMGPFMAVGDLDGDGEGELVLGSSVGGRPAVLRMPPAATLSPSHPFTGWDSSVECGPILIDDFDGDGIRDVVFVPSGNEYPDGDARYRVQLWKGRADGSFDQQPFADVRVSSSAAFCLDIDEDGRPDIVIGGRVTPHGYPLTPESFVLMNTPNGFVVATDMIAPGLREIGMVSSMATGDLNGDGRPDLVVVGEYMAPQVFINTDGRLVLTDMPGISGPDLRGMWNCVATADLNRDGIDDIVLGNIGLNTRWKMTPDAPRELFAVDLDDNGSLDVISTYRENGRTYPIKPLAAYKMRINGLAKRYFRHADFGKADIHDILGEAKYWEAMHLTACEPRSGILLSGKGGHRFIPLPIEAQFSPVMCILVTDLDGDGNDDLILGGNLHHVEVEQGPFTAFRGLVLPGNGAGGFTPLSHRESGYLVRGESRQILGVRSGGAHHVLTAVNNAMLRVHRLNLGMKR